MPFDEAIASGAYDDHAGDAGGHELFDPSGGSFGAGGSAYGGSGHGDQGGFGYNGRGGNGGAGIGGGHAGGGHAGGYGGQQGGGRGAGGWSGQRSGGSDWKSGGRFGKPVEGWKAVDPTPHSRRAPPASPADHALRMLLLHSDWWDQLGADDHQLLHELPQAHGQLCAWLERQLAESGPTPWSALIAGLVGHELERLARHLVPSDAMEDTLAFVELRRVIDLMWIERLKAEETRLIATAASDPKALVRYRQVHERRRGLEQAAVPGSPPS
jgi:DNA primase